MTLLPSTGANASSFCATYNSQPVHWLPHARFRKVGDEGMAMGWKPVPNVGMFGEHAVIAC